MKDIKKLRKRCLNLMVKNDYAKRGGQTILAKKMGVNRNQLSMALSGFRETESSRNILKSLKSFLLSQ